MSQKWLDKQMIEQTYSNDSQSFRLFTTLWATILVKPLVVPRKKMKSKSVFPNHSSWLTPFATTCQVCTGGENLKQNNAKFKTGK